jgi:hypothetical protein
MGGVIAYMPPPGEPGGVKGQRFRARVRAAFFAAMERVRGPLVAEAFLAARDRSAAECFCAARRVCLASARWEAAMRPFRRRAFEVASRASSAARCMVFFSGMFTLLDRDGRSREACKGLTSQGIRVVSSLPIRAVIA